MSIYERLSDTARTRRENERVDCCARTLVRLRLDTDDVSGATKIIDEIVSARRAMAPSLCYEADLASALTEASYARSRAGQRAFALRDAQDAVALRRALARVDPRRHNADLCESLRRLSDSQADAGYSKAALASIEECVRIRTSLWTEDPKRFRIGLANDLWALSERFRVAGDVGKALQAMIGPRVIFESWRRCALNVSQ